MFRYSGEKIPMSDSDSDVWLFGHALAGKVGDGRSHRWPYRWMTSSGDLLIM